MKKISIKYLSLMIVAVFTISSVMPAMAQAQTLDTSKGIVTLTESEKNSIKELEEFGVDAELMTKLLEVSNYIQLNKDGKTLSVDLSDQVLTSEYGFSNTQLEDFKAVLDGTYQSLNSIEYSSPVAETYAVRAGYLSNNALTAGVFASLTAAAYVGPAALMAAWTLASTALAGPLGTVAGLSTAVLGGAFFANLAMKITGAVAQGKGVAFYLTWGIPPVKPEIE